MMPSVMRERTVARFCGLGRLTSHKTRVPRPDDDTRSSSALPGSDRVTYIREDSIFFNHQAARTLLNNSYVVFSILQKHKLAKNRNADTNFDPGYEIFDVDPADLSLVHVSRAYRRFLRDCTAELLKNKDTNKMETLYLSSIFFSLELIFHLAEILNLDHSQNSHMVPKLQEWIQYYFNESSDLADSVIKSRDDKSPVECNPDFWPAVTGLIMTAQCKEARRLLGLHSKKETPAIRTLRQLLHSKPELQSSGGASVAINFSVQWEAWLKEVRNQLISGVFSTNQHCLELAELLAGDNKAEKLVYENSETWYKFLVTYVSYWKPTVESFRLGEIARKSMERFGMDSQMKAVDKILLALFESDLYQVIESLQEFAESGWASLHMTDLLYHAGLLSNVVGQDNKIAENLRTDLIIQFGTLLAANDCVWRTGLSYLDFAGSQGVGHIDLILQSRGQKSAKDAEILLYEAGKRNLVKAERTICSVVSRQYLMEKRLGSALMWAIKGDNHSLASSVAELVLREMAVNDEYSISDVLPDLGTSIISSGHLVFLVKYNEYLTKYHDGNKKEAVTILIDLITSGLAPPYFIPVLLKKSAQAAKEAVKVFNSTDLSNILGVLEELVVTAHINGTKDAKSAVASLESSEREIREVLAQSICQAEIAELAKV
ncbi:nuclear pore complex protein Nup85 [Cloeon dipterum]|uniref:nuclear pore complex protein Nup85 n=1 Tax=Cloeon dipterum TaxID=197152 RepID=UPI00321F998B